MIVRTRPVLALATAGVLLCGGCTSGAPPATTAAVQHSSVAITARSSAVGINGGASGTTVPKSGLELGPMTLTSTAFPADGLMPVTYSCAGDNISPPLSWHGAAPAGIGSWALVMQDLDVHPGPWLQWVVTDIAPSTRKIDPGQLPSGAVAHRTSNNTSGFVGVCPPAGKVHRYRFTVYAVSAGLRLSRSEGATESLLTIKQAAITSVVLTGRFNR